MAKFIKYKIHFPTEGGDVFFDKSMTYSPENEEIAKREAYKGKYTIEDDGQPEPVSEPSMEDVLNAMLGVSE